MTPVVGEICYAVIMVDTALIARKHAMVQWWYGYVVCTGECQSIVCFKSTFGPRFKQLRPS
jgi:hypothetical protein